MPSLKTALFLASGAVLLPSLADASGFPERALVSAARQIARNEMATGARFGSGVPGTAAETATASDRRGLAEVLTPEQYVEKFDLCPWIAAIAKCSLLTTSAACNADSDCTYTPDATDPESSKYPCVPADSNPSEITDMLFIYHSSDILYAGTFCDKTYDSEESACDADERCEWDDSDDTCGSSGDAYATISRGHPHFVRSYAISQTCETIETETLCGVGDTADKCEWLEASSGDEAGCFATFTYTAQQLSCECDAVKTAAPSVDYSNLVCATPNVEFVDVYSGARTFEGGALLGGALTLAACVLALA